MATLHHRVNVQDAYDRLSDLDMEDAARHADVPDANFYNLSGTDHTEPGGFYTLAVVLIAVCCILGVLFEFLRP